jgi:signal transduction histidine kinase
VKFTPAGGRIKIIGRFDEASGIAITVKDTGIGIAPENLARVLEPFVQIGSPVRRDHAGTGLGLPAAKRIMELHQGTLSLQSTLGVGTEATVIFPPERAVARTDKQIAVSAS